MDCIWSFDRSGRDRCLRLNWKRLLSYGCLLSVSLLSTFYPVRGVEAQEKLSCLKMTGTLLGKGVCPTAAYTVFTDVCSAKNDNWQTKLSNDCRTDPQEGKGCSAFIHRNGARGDQVLPVLWKGLNVSGVSEGACPDFTEDSTCTGVTFHMAPACGGDSECPAGQHKWPSNGNCYPCEEGKIKRNVGSEKAPNFQCRPRCEGLTGQAKTKCEECDISGGVACRCNQLKGPAQEICRCIAFGGGDACYKCPANTYKWPDKSCRECPPGSPYKWANGQCRVCPENLPFKWKSGQCKQCPEDRPYKIGFNNCSKCPADRPLLKGNRCLPDADADTVEDPRDNCPYDKNPLQEDTDRNNIGDACEGCKKRWKGASNATLLNGSSLKLRSMVLGPAYKGDEVTIESFLSSCEDPDVEIVTLQQQSGGVKTNTHQDEVIESEFTSLTSSFDQYFGKLTNTGKKAYGWARVSKICPVDTQVLSCPPSTADNCSQSQFQGWVNKTKIWEEQLATVYADHYPLLGDINIPIRVTEGLMMIPWIQNDAKEKPPYLAPAPVSYSTAQEEEELERIYASQPPGSLSPPDLVQLALEVVGCGGSRCSSEQWYKANLAGHNVLKNAAHLIRHTGPCTPDMQNGAWIPHAPNEKSATDLCNWYGKRFQDEKHRVRLNQKFTIAKNIARAIENPRPSCYDNANGLGPSYHMFAFGLVHWYSGGFANPIANFYEKKAQEGVGNNDRVYRRLNDMQADALLKGHQRIGS